MKRNLGDHNPGLASKANANNATDTLTDKNAGLKTIKRTLNLVVDDVPYLVKATPFSFNDGTRFYISVNEGAEHVFTWDPDMLRFRSIDDSAGELPDTLEKAISEKIQTKYRPDQKPNGWR
jgi:hypothetical protein